MGKVGLVLDAAVAAGSNSIQSVGLDILNPQQEKDKALTLAIEDARRKAEVAAKAAGPRKSRSGRSRPLRHFQSRARLRQSSLLM